MPSDLIGELAQNGILALLLAIVLVAYYAKDKEVKEAKKEFTDYLLAKGEKDGELKNQLLTFMQNISNAVFKTKQ